MSLETSDNFINVLEQVRPGALEAPGETIASKIAYCMRQEQDPHVFQNLWVLLQIDMEKPLGLYNCVTHVRVSDATHEQAYASIVDRASQAVTVAKKRFYVY
jgi:hypothetical protein